MKIFYGDDYEYEIEPDYVDMYDFLRKKLLECSKEDLIEEILQCDSSVEELVLWYKEDFIDYWRENNG